MKIRHKDEKLEVEKMRDGIIGRRIADSLVTARIREELDFFTNMRKEDRIVVSGLTSRVPVPLNPEEKRKWLRDLVGEVLEQVEASSSQHILVVMQGWKGQNNVPVAEVRMSSVELASKLRKQFAIKKRAGKDFGRIFMANSVTLGTRVRVEILRAVAKSLAGDAETMYVTAFTSRPLLHVKPKDTSSRAMAYTFADAMTKYGQQMRQEDLGEAYRRAGLAFRGQLQQNFVVLHESCPPVVTPWVRGQSRGALGGPVGTSKAKRRLEEESGGSGISGTPEKK